MINIWWNPCFILRVIDSLEESSKSCDSNLIKIAVECTLALLTSLNELTQGNGIIDQELITVINDEYPSLENVKEDEPQSMHQEEQETLDWVSVKRRIEGQSSLDEQDSPNEINSKAKTDRPQVVELSAFKCKLSEILRSTSGDSSEQSTPKRTKPANYSAVNQNDEEVDDDDLETESESRSKSIDGQDERYESCESLNSGTTEGPEECEQSPERGHLKKLEQTREAAEGVKVCTRFMPINCAV